MVIFGGVDAVIRALSIACHYKNSKGTFTCDIKLEGEKIMAGLKTMVTSLKAGAGPWRGRL